MAGARRRARRVRPAGADARTALVALRRRWRRSTSSTPASGCASICAPSHGRRRVSILGRVPTAQPQHPATTRVRPSHSELTRSRPTRSRGGTASCSRRSRSARGATCSSYCGWERTRLAGQTEFVRQARGGSGHVVVPSMDRDRRPARQALAADHAKALAHQQKRQHRTTPPTTRAAARRATRRRPRRRRRCHHQRWCQSRCSPREAPRSRRKRLPQAPPPPPPPPPTPQVWPRDAQPIVAAARLGGWSSTRGCSTTCCPTSNRSSTSPRRRSSRPAPRQGEERRVAA